MKTRREVAAAMLQVVILAVVFGLMGAWMIASANSQADGEIEHAARYHDDLGTAGCPEPERTFSPTYWEEEYEP